MALRQWSSEIYTAEFRELQASTFCCSRDGRLGLLAGAISSMSVVFFHHSTSGCLKPSLIFKYFHQEGEVLAFSVWSSPTNWWDEPQGAAGDFFTFTFFCWPLSVPTNSDGRSALANGTQASSLETTSLSAATTRRASMFFMLKNNLSRKKIW